MPATKLVVVSVGSRTRQRTPAVPEVVATARNASASPATFVSTADVASDFVPTRSEATLQSSIPVPLSLMSNGWPFQLPFDSSSRTPGALGLKAKVIVQLSPTLRLRPWQLWTPPNLPVGGAPPAPLFVTARDPILLSARSWSCEAEPT